MLEELEELESVEDGTKESCTLIYSSQYMANSFLQGQRGTTDKSKPIIWSRPGTWVL